MATLRNKITEYLQEIHGQKKEIWDTTISEFVYIMGIMSDLKKDVKDNGIFTLDRYKQKKINPSLKTYIELYPKLLALMAELQITPKAFFKMMGNNEDDNIEDFISSLTSDKITD